MQLVRNDGQPNWWVAAFAVVVVIAFWMVIASAVWGLSVATAGVYGRGEARKQIQSASFRITAYDHFFNLCAAVQTDEVQLDALGRELATAGDADRGRINANISGVTAARAGSINQYNADARKDYTEGQFRDSDLPYQLPSAAFKEGTRTSCGNG